jgi:hypothetical protein
VQTDNDTVKPEAELGDILDVMGCTAHAPA